MSGCGVPWQTRYRATTPQGGDNQRVAKDSYFPRHRSMGPAWGSDLMTNTIARERLSPGSFALVRAQFAAWGQVEAPVGVRSSTH